MPQLPPVSELMISSQSHIKKTSKNETPTSPNIPRISTSKSLNNESSNPNNITSNRSSIVNNNVNVPVRRSTEPSINYQASTLYNTHFANNSQSEYFNNNYQSIQRKSISSSIDPLSRQPSNNQLTLSSSPVVPFQHQQPMVLHSSPSATHISYPPSAHHISAPPPPPPAIYNPAESYFQPQFHQQQFIQHTTPPHPSMASMQQLAPMPHSAQYYYPVYQDMPYMYQSQSMPYEENNALLNKRRIIKRRTRSGCLTCRKRRIKCDERKPHCFNCERSKKVCLGYENLTSLKLKRKKQNGEEEENTSHRNNNNNNSSATISNNTSNNITNADAKDNNNKIITNDINTDDFNTNIDNNNSNIQKANDSTKVSVYDLIK